MEGGEGEYYGEGAMKGGGGAMEGEGVLWKEVLWRGSAMEGGEECYGGRRDAMEGGAMKGECYGAGRGVLWREVLGRGAMEGGGVLWTGEGMLWTGKGECYGGGVLWRSIAFLPSDILPFSSAKGWIGNMSLLKNVLLLHFIRPL